MARGGARKGAGKKSTWVSGCKFNETTTIRIPKTIKAQLLEIAHKLDANEALDSVTKLSDKVTESYRLENDQLKIRMKRLEESLARTRVGYQNLEEELKRLKIKK